MGGMPRRRSAALALVCLAVTACTGGEATPPPSGPLLPTSVDALPQMDASAFSTLLAQQRGTPVVVNIWAAWCDPCREEAPGLAAAAARYGDRVRFVGVDMQDNRGDAQAFIQRYGLPYPSVFDAQNTIGLSYDVASPPATLFFTADGTLARTVPGQISADDLEQGLRLITGPSGP
jgi:thiol-disulfide isomerase/thioredoxin